jgi:hypothetical protein
MAIATDSASMRARILFSEPEHQSYGPEFLKDLKEEWRSVLAGQKRAMIYMVLGMALFELVVRGAIGKATFLGIELSDLAIVRKALPVVVAYFFYEAATSNTHSVIFFDVYDTIFRQLQPAIADAKLHMLTAPARPAIQGPLMYRQHTPGFENKRFIRGLDLLFNLISMLGILAFEIYAYVLQFAAFRATDPLTWIALVATLLFLVVGFFGPYLI